MYNVIIKNCNNIADGHISIIPNCKQSSKMHTFSPANAHFFTASF
jgi:hypothetical protein